MSKGTLFVTSGSGSYRPRFETAVRRLLLVLPLLLVQVPAAQAQLSVGIGIEIPGVSIGVNLPTFPDLQRVPGYPVYYAPDARGNYFYYDGLYWVFQGDDWYASSWYNGPWQRVTPLYVPAYVLRVPVYYYRQPPPYFSHWRADEPPRWDQHWGREWQQRRPDWDHWDRHAAPPPAPLPAYQRRHPHSRYPQESTRQQAVVALPPARPAGPRPHAQQPPRQQDRAPVAQPSQAPRRQAAPQERGRPQGRAEPFNPRPPKMGDDPLSGRSSIYQQVRPVQQTPQRPASAQAPRAQPSPQPRPQPYAQHLPRQQERPQAAHPSQAQQDRDQPHGRPRTSNRRLDKPG